MWLKFPFDPSVYLGLALAGVAYWYLSARFGAERRHRIWFFAGLALVWLALETPLDTLGDTYLQSAHMVQHMLLVSFAPPLLWLGLPDALTQAIARLPGLGRLLTPLPALALYTLGVLGWHVPLAFDAALANPALHIGEHLTFLAVGLLYWWSALPGPTAAGRSPLDLLGRVLYLGAGTIPMMLVALTLQFSRVLFYAPYGLAPRIIPALTPVADQTLSGAIMFTMDMAAVAVAFGVEMWQALKVEVGQEAA